MHKKDYIQSQLEEFGKVLALILGFKNLKDWDAFEKEIQEAAQKFTSLDVDAIENLSAESFDSEIVMSEKLSHDQKKIIATLLFEKLNLYLLKNETARCKQSKTKCIALYQHLRDNFSQNQFDLDVHYKLDLLAKLQE